MAHKIKIEGIIGFNACNMFIRRELSRAKGQDVMVEIASPGGMISEGLKMFNSLKNYEGNVDVHLTGQVSSMASYLAMVGKRRTAERNATFMIHNAEMMGAGDHRLMFRLGNHLNSLSNIIAKEFALKSGTELDEIREAMDETTTYYGNEIQEAGFVHEITGDEEPGDRAEAVAMAKLMFDECQTKINTPELIEKDITALATMMADEPDEIEKLKAEKLKAETALKEIKLKQKQEDTVMTLQEIKEKFADVYNQIVAIGTEAGLKEGLDQERARVKMLTEMRAKFPKAHSQKVIDEAIAEGHDLNQLTLNLMSADQVAAELEAAKKDPPPPGNGEGDAPEMVNDEMTHPDHIDARSAQTAALPGVM